MQAICTSVGLRIDILDNAASRDCDTPNERNVESVGSLGVDSVKCARGIDRDKWNRSGAEVLGTSCCSESGPSESISTISPSCPLSVSSASVPSPSPPESLSTLSIGGVFLLRFLLGSSCLCIRSSVVRALRLMPVILSR